MMSLSVWLLGPMFLPEGSFCWVSVQGCPGTQRNISWTEILWTETYLDRDPLDKDTRYDIKRAVHILLECILVRFFFHFFYYFAIVRLLFEVLE